MTTITVTTHAQLNALVAEKVMGWKWEPDFPESDTIVRIVESVMKNPDGDEVFFRTLDGRTLSFEHDPNYSTDLNAAELVARKTGLILSFCGPFAIATEAEGGVHVTHESTAIAICLASLRCEGVDVELQLQEGN